MLTHFHVRNFKSIEDSGELELKPLTILTGRNASGKSSIMEALAILAQSVRLGEEGPRPGPIEQTLENSVRIGQFVSYPDITYIAYKADRSRSISFEIHAEPSADTHYKYPDEQQVQGSSIGYGYSYRPDNGETSASIFVNHKKTTEVRGERVGSNYVGRGVFPNDFKDRTLEKAPREILQSNCFSAFLPREATAERAPIRQDLTDLARVVTEDFVQKLKHVYLLKTQRGEVPAEVRTREEPHELPTPSWVGKNGEHLIEILALCHAGQQHSVKADRITKWAERFGIGNVKAGWRGHARVGSDFIDVDLGTPLQLVSASYGSKQVLTMITQLFWSDARDLIMIEEPEISLHPESQVLLLNLFATVIEENKQIICNSQSLPHPSPVGSNQEW
jgi:predicted ATPase